MIVRFNESIEAKHHISWLKTKSKSNFFKKFAWETFKLNNLY